MCFNRHKFNYFYRPERDDWINDTYQLIDDEYFCLPYTVDEYKLADGQGRRKSFIYKNVLAKNNEARS